MEPGIQALLKPLTKMYKPRTMTFEVGKGDLKKKFGQADFEGKNCLQHTHTHTKSQIVDPL